MKLDLEGKHAVIAGGSRGIGKAIAKTLAAEGCSLTLVARDGESLARAEAEVIAQAPAASIQTLSIDLSNPAGIGSLASQVHELDILVNCASAVPPGSLFDVPDAEWRAGFDLKVFGYVALTRVLYSAVARSRGVIVNVIGASRADPNFIGAVVAGTALTAFTETLGKAAARDGLRVVGVSPGPVATERGECFLRARARKELGDEARWREYHARLPFGRAASAQEIADAVAFLASPRSAYTNGTVLTIHGAPN